MVSYQAAKCMSQCNWGEKHLSPARNCFLWHNGANLSFQLIVLNQALIKTWQSCYDLESLGASLYNIIFGSEAFNRCLTCIILLHEVGVVRKKLSKSSFYFRHNMVTTDLTSLGKCTHRLWVSYQCIFFFFYFFFVLFMKSTIKEKCLATKVYDE